MVGSHRSPQEPIRNNSEREAIGTHKETHRFFCTNPQEASQKKKKERQEDELEEGTEKEVEMAEADAGGEGRRWRLRTGGGGGGHLG